MGRKDELCFKNDKSDDDTACMTTNDGVASDKVKYNIRRTTVSAHSSLVNIHTKGQGYIEFEFLTGSTLNVSPDPIPGTH